MVTADEDGDVSVETLWSIGDFARHSGLTPKALRLYDELGLVVPTEVDPFTGYRRYAAGQLPRARLVASLRLTGMPLARIRAVIDLPAPAAAREIEAYWRQVEADTASRRDVVTALVRQLRSEEPTMPTPTSALHAEIGVSHRQGGRATQQDAVWTQPDLVAIADGFGTRDDLAAAALTSFAARGFDAAVAAAAPDGNDAGTTLTAVRIDGAVGHITHVGDGRVHLLRGGRVDRLTHDHTMVAALVESGQLTEDEARSHPHRSLLNRGLSGEPVVADETTVDLRPGDRLILTTDGVHGVLGEDAMADLLRASSPPQAVAEAIGAAVEEAGAPDNHTVVVADLS